MFKNQENMTIKFQALTLCLLILIPLVVGECTCERDSEDESGKKSDSLKYKVGAIIAILIASATGVGIPMLGKILPALQPEKNLFFIIKAFAAGVILATALIHILPDAFVNLTSPCLDENPWGNFPFTGFVTMVSAIGTLIIDTVATSYFTRMQFKNTQTQPDSSDNNSREGDEENNIKKMVAQHSDHLHMHAHASDGHSHGSFNSPELLRHRIITQVLELGIVVHSVIIGITLGASQSPKTIKPLMAALVFHQFFEGMGLGGCISQAKFKSRAIVIMGLFFSLTTPIGIAIGIGISNGYDENSPKSLIIQGILDAASAGILIYMSLVDLLAADFMNPKVQNSGKLQIGANVSLLVGAGCMSVLAKWA